MKNKIEIKNNVVYKTYSSRIDYVKEESLYKKLKGSGLSPELYESHDGYIEHEYVQGENFMERIASANGDHALLEEYFKKFFEWYEKYRELTKMTLGHVRFEKFILSGNRLCNLDFEHCKPGYAEEDIARLVAQMCIGEEPFGSAEMDTARFFVYVGTKCMEWIPDLLYAQLPKAIISECKKKGIPVNENKMEILSTLLTSTGIVFAGGDTPLAECAAEMQLMPQRIVSAPKARFGNTSLDGFVKVVSYGTLNNTLERIVDSQKNVNQVWTVCITSDMPKLPQILWDAVLAADKKDYAAVMVEAAGKLREFPIILNTAKTRLELESAFKKGKTSLTEVLSSMPVNIIKVESIRSK